MAISSEELKRIADALEEILRLVKEDQERTRKYMEEKKDEQEPRITESTDPNTSLEMVRS